MYCFGSQFRKSPNYLTLQTFLTRELLVSAFIHHTNVSFLSAYYIVNLESKLSINIYKWPPFIKSPFANAKYNQQPVSNRNLQSQFSFQSQPPITDQLVKYQPPNTDQLVKYQPPITDQLVKYQPPITAQLTKSTPNHRSACKISTSNHRSACKISTSNHSSAYKVNPQSQISL